MSSLQQLSHHQHLLRWVAHHQRHLLGIGIGFIISFSGGIVFVVVLVILIIAFIGGGTIDSGVGVETPLTKTPEKAPPSCESSSPELAFATHAKSPGTRHSKQQLAIPASSLRIRPFAAACCSRIHVRDAAPPPVLTSSRPEHQIAAHAGTPATIGGCGFGA